MSKITLYILEADNRAEIVSEKPFKLEREMQRVFEDNLGLIMGLEMVKSEFTIKDKRIDTLAFDRQSNSFVIIEYKRDKNNSVFDQGITYLNLMLNYKADFVLEYNENMKNNLLRDDVDWSQSRVVFVSSDFTENQIQATNFKDFAIELWEVKRYSNNTISINNIGKSKSAPSIKPILETNKTFQDISREIKVYSEEDHLKGKSDEIIELYEKFKNAILNLKNDLEVVYRKNYIGFKLDKRNISDIEVQAKQLKLYININKGQLDDPKGLMRDISNIGHWGNGDYQTLVNNDDDLEYIMSLIKQAIK
jgi:predicted transport protein